MFVPQAKLPDINNALVTHRLSAISSFKRRDYDSCKTAIFSIIALLPESYKVSISTQEYDTELATIQLIICPNCQAKSQTLTDADGNKTSTYNPPRLVDVRKVEVYHDPVDQLLLDTKRSKSWICPDCNITHLLNQNTQYAKSAPQNPYYAKIIPSPPLRTSFFKRVGFSQEFSHWFQIAMTEIENQIQLYRTEYISQNQAADQDVSAELLNEIEGI